MKKQLIAGATTLGVLSLVVLPTVVFAQSGVDAAQGALSDIAGRVGFTIDTTNPEANIAQIVGGVIRTLLAVLGIVFMALTIYGGWLWMTAAGNQERVARAKDLLRDSVFGIIIIVAAYAITTFVVIAITESLTTIAS